MNTLHKTLLALGISLTIVAIILVSNGKGLISGSVESSAGAYMSTSTINLTAPTTGTALASPKTLTTGPGTLGSLIITGANTATINFYDATSTAAHSDYATTTLVSFPASAAAGTYTFDLEFKRGLVVEIVGTVATGTITWKK